MKSKTLSFNPAIILTNLKRFWWTSALYVIIGFLTGPLSILRTDIEYYIERGREIRLNNIYGSNALILCFAAVIIGTMVVRYLQNSSSVTLLHAMPFTRLRLYVENWASGLILIILPILINFGIMFGISKFSEYGLCINNGELFEILLMIMLSAVTLYTITVMVGMFTGSSIAQIVFTYILNFLPIAFVYGFYALLYKIVYGLTEPDGSALEGVLVWLPITQFIGEMDIAKVWVVNLIVTVIAFVIGYVVYKFRDLETAGDVISNKILKPIFKYGFTVCVMAAGVIYIKYAFEIPSPNFLIYLVFALLGYIIAEMLLRKSFKILDSYKGFIGFIGAFALVVCIVKFDLVGYERRIPSFDRIEAVAVGRYFDANEIFTNEDYYVSNGAVLKDTETILKVMDLHQTIIDERPKDSSNYTRTRIAYKLKNGNIIQRDYEIKVNENGSNETIDKKLNELYNLEEYKKQTHEIFKWNEDDLVDVIINSYRNVKIGEDIERRVEEKVISDKEQVTKLLELTKQAILENKSEDREQNTLGYLEFRYKREELPQTIVFEEGYIVETKGANYDYVVEHIYDVDSELVSYISGLGYYLE